MLTNKRCFAMSPTAISEAVREEIQRFESVHPNIYAIHDLIEEIENSTVQQRLRDHILSIEDAFVNSQEWTLSRSVQDLKLGVVGTFNSGKAPMVHHYLTGSYLNEESFEGGRFKKEISIESQSYLLLIREEGGPPDLQFSQWVDAVMFVYNASSESSFNTIYTYYAKMSLYRNMSELPIFLIASLDGIGPTNPRLVTELKGRKMAADLKSCHYMEVSAERAYNVHEVFHEACHQVVALRQPANAGTCQRGHQRSQQVTSFREQNSGISIPPLLHPPPHHQHQHIHEAGGFGGVAPVPPHHIPQGSQAPRRMSKPDRNGIPIPMENGCNSDMSNSLHSILPSSFPLNSVDLKTSFLHSERIDSFLKEFPMSKEKSSNKTSYAVMQRQRSCSIQSIEQQVIDDDGDGCGEMATPNTTPTPGRKNNRRKSNIFASKKDCDDKKVKVGDKMGVGRVIPIKQGWLFKYSNKPLTKGWQKKYVTLLDDGRLTYHSSLTDYMENCHGKEVKLGQTTVKIPGQRPRGSEVSKTTTTTTSGGGGGSTAHLSRQSELNLASPAHRGSISSTSSSVRMGDSIVIQNPGVGTSLMAGQQKAETPLSKKKHKRVKSNSRTLDENEGGFEFVIVSLEGKQWHFEANSLEERDEWVSAVEQQICSSLRLNWSSKAQATSSANAAIISKMRSVPGNDMCADCGAMNPEWASLNLGALICIECSGIHRNLGTHLSRVRSLELDEWPDNLVAVMKSIGNNMLNSVWEANAIGCRKPTSTSSREEKDKWIRMKYELKNYLPPLPFEGVPVYQQLMDAVARNDVKSTILVLAYCTPAEVNRPHSPSDTRTALHVAAAVGSVVLVQLLLWYGANPELLDHENHNAAFYAKNHRAFECLKILESQMVH